MYLICIYLTSNTHSSALPCWLTHYWMTDLLRSECAKSDILVFSLCSRIVSGPRCKIRDLNKWHVCICFHSGDILENLQIMSTKTSRSCCCCCRKRNSLGTNLTFILMTHTWNGWQHFQMRSLKKGCHHYDDFCSKQCCRRHNTV